MCSLAAAVYSLTRIPIYEASVRLMIESDDRNIVAFQPVVEEGQSASGYYETQYRILASRSLAARTASQEGLDRPIAQDTSSSFSLRATLTSIVEWPQEWVRPLLGANDQPEDPSEDASASAAIDAFLGSLDVSPVRNSRLVDLRYRSSDPELAASVVNRHARNFIEQNLEYKFLSSREASEWLGLQLDDRRDLVDQSESRLQQYREASDSVSLGGASEHRRAGAKALFR